MTANAAKKTTPRPEAAARRGRIAANLQAATDDLVAAWRGRDWLDYGLPTWEAYVESVSPAGVKITLAPELLPERILELVNGGMSVRAAAPVVGASKTKVAELLRRPDVAERVTATTTRGLDGREQTRTRAARSVTVTQTPAKAPTTVDRVVDVIAAGDPGGLNVVEVGRRLRWHHGQTSGALSKAERRGRLVRVYVPGERFGRYLVPTSR